MDFRSTACISGSTLSVSLPSFFGWGVRCLDQCIIPFLSAFFCYAGLPGFVLFSRIRICSLSVCVPGPSITVLFTSIDSLVCSQITPYFFSVCATFPKSSAGSYSSFVAPCTNTLFPFSTRKKMYYTPYALTFRSRALRLLHARAGAQAFFSTTSTKQSHTFISSKRMRFLQGSHFAFAPTTTTVTTTTVNLFSHYMQSPRPPLLNATFFTAPG